MKLFNRLGLLCSIGIVLVAASETQQDNKASRTDSKRSEEADINEDGEQKRFFGNVLSSGFKMGKKSNGDEGTGEADDLTNELKRWYFGSLIGKGFKAGKRAFDDENEESVGADIEQVDLNGPIDDKRWSGLGPMYGKGYFLPNGRYKRDADKRFIHYFGRGLSIGEREGRSMGGDSVFSDSEASDGEDNGRADIEDFDGFVGNDFDPELEAAKRYIGTNPGHRFDFGFGKRPYDMFDVPNAYKDYAEDSPYEKRAFGHVLGRGLSFGKRNQRKRRPFGYVLGRGLSFGKRSNNDLPYPEGEEMENMYDSEYNDNEMQKRFGFVLGRGFFMGKRGSKRFGWILGRGLKFGKRSESEIPYDASPVSGEYVLENEDQYGDYYGPSYEKRRFGHILGSGFAFGKRSQEADVEFVPEKRFGFMLGRGFRLGRR